jgi:death-on-curing protein
VSKPKPPLRPACGLLEFALAQPRTSFRGKEVRKSVFDKAAAYGFHLCNNHPIIDGNKRVAFVLMDDFLQKNGWEIRPGEEESYSMMISLASGEFSSWLNVHAARVK